MAQHGRAVFLEGVAGAHASTDLRAEIAPLEGELLDLGERADEVLLDVVRERLERRDVDDVGVWLEAAGDGLAQQ